MQTTYVGIREAKIHLSKYLKLVQQGNEIILTDRGTPVGKIVPVQQKELPLKQRLKKMEEKGWLQALPANHLPSLPDPIPLKHNRAQSILTEDRNGGK